jgi:hypothetical protein
VFTAPLHSNGRCADHIENTVLLLRSCILRALHSNDRYLQSHSLATSIYTKILSRVRVTLDGVWTYWQLTNQECVDIKVKVKFTLRLAVKYKIKVNVKVTSRLAVYHQSVRLGANSLKTRQSIFSPQLNPCGHGPYITSSLMRVWVCRLKLLLALASAVNLKSDSRGTHDLILLSQIRDSPTWRARFPYLYTPGTGWPSYIPQALGSLFVASYDSQVYGGRIGIRLTKGHDWRFTSVF